MPTLALDPVPILETTDSGLLRFRDNVQLNWDKLNAIVNNLDSANIKDGSIGTADLDTAVVQMFAVGNSLAGGAAPTPTPEGIPYKIQAGTNVITTNGGGGTGPINFPVAFPNGLLSVMAINGDAGASDNVICSMYNQNVSDFEIIALKSDGTRFASAVLRFNWIAIGW